MKKILQIVKTSIAKNKKLYIIGAAIVALLVVFIVMGVTNPNSHAGHDHGPQATADPHAGHDHNTTTKTTTTTTGAQTTTDSHAGHDDNTTAKTTTTTTGAQTTTNSHAGHDHNTTAKTTTAKTTGITPNKELTPDKAYTVQKNNDGTCNVHVTGRSGNQISSEKFNAKLSFAEVNQDILEIADRTSKNTADHWSKYYDIEHHRVSRIFRFVLATKDHHVAYVDQRNGTFFLFVSDVFDESAYLKWYELKGIANTKSGSPEISYKLNGTTLTVTYSTEKGTNSMDIKMFEK